MRLTTRPASQCLLSRPYPWWRPAPSRLFPSVRLMASPGPGPVARSSAILGHMPRPGPRTHPRLILLREHTPFVRGQRRPSLAREVAPTSGSVDVALVWDPPWSPAMMSEAAREVPHWPEH